MTVSAIVLAAGEGSRMRSSRPKPLHLICGRPMVVHVIHALEQVTPWRTIVVVGHGAEQVTKKVQEQAPDWANVSFVEQTVQAGTGDATLVGLSALPGAGLDDDLDDTSTVVVLPGDTPLLQAATLDALVAAHNANEYAATLITSVLDDPTGYGRVIRAPSKQGDGRVLRIVEQRDADADERAIQEVCTSMYAFRRDLLGPALRHLSPENAQGEHYLTDVVGALATMGHRIGCVQAPAAETQGVNDRWQLALAERELRSRTNRRWLLNGVTMLDPRQTFVDVTVKLGRDVTLYPGTILQGSTVIGDGCEIGPDTRLIDCAIGTGATVEHAVGRESEVGEAAHVGPYAFLPSGSSVKPGTITGAFSHCTCRMNAEHDSGRMMEKVTTKRMSLYSGRTHPALAQEVAEHLGIELGQPNAVQFANGEVRVRFGESVRGSDVFIMQTHCGYDGLSINDSIMEQLIMCDAAFRASAKRITAVCPFYGYGRQDRKTEGREPITARLIADLFKAAGAKRMVSIDLHSGQIQGFFEGPVDHLTAMPVLENFVRKNAQNTPPVIVAPDAGRIKVAERMSQHLGDLGADLAFIYKRRPKGTTNVAEAKEVMGDVEGRLCIVIDDMIDSGGTICSAADVMMARGATEVWAMATHAVLSGPAIDRLKNSVISKVVVTNTLPLSEEKQIDKIEVLSIAPLIADALGAVFDDTSVSEIFGGENQS